MRVTGGLAVVTLLLAGCRAHDGAAKLELRTWGADIECMDWGDDLITFDREGCFASEGSPRSLAGCIAEPKALFARVDRLIAGGGFTSEAKAPVYKPCDQGVSLAIVTGDGRRLVGADAPTRAQLEELIQLLFKTFGEATKPVGPGPASRAGFQQLELYEEPQLGRATQVWLSSDGRWLCHHWSPDTLRPMSVAFGRLPDSALLDALLEGTSGLDPLPGGGVTPHLRIVRGDREYQVTDGPSVTLIRSRWQARARTLAPACALPDENAGGF